MNSRRCLVTAVVAAVGAAAFPLVTSAQVIWTGSAGDGKWGTGGNWSANRIPLVTEEAVFGSGSTTAITVIGTDALNQVGTITFSAGAPAITFTVPATKQFNIGYLGTAGIVNNSSSQQKIVNAGGGDNQSGGITMFTLNTSAGNLRLENQGAINNSANLEVTSSGGVTVFNDTSKAGTATIFNYGGQAAYTGRTHFQGTSSAENATIVNAGGVRSGGFGGATEFANSATAGSATIINQRAITAYSGGGDTYFYDTSTAGSANITAEGGSSSLSGGSIVFFNSSTAGAATLTAQGGTGGGTGGLIQFSDTATGGTARIIVQAGDGVDANSAGALTLGQLTTSSLTVGSIEGSGRVSLSSKNLTVGGLNTNTEFSGVMEDGGGSGGSLTKTGTGTLILSGNNTYIGSTTISQGVLQLGNGGTTGTVAGPITNNASLVFNLSGPLVVSNVIGGTGTLTQSGAGTLGLTGTNTYSGPTVINGSILTASQLGNGGVAGSLGQSTNAAANLVLNGGTLQYSGSSAASTDRLFTIGSGGGTIDSSSSTATNTLTFANTGAVVFSGTGTRTLSLAGTNTGSNTFATVIGDNGAAATSLVKNGTGKWTLTGANTYSGGTTVNAGTLAFSGSGSLGTGAITLAGGALDLAAATKSLGTLTLSGGTLQNGTASITNLNAQSGTVSAILSSVGGTGVALNKTGTGTLTLSGANTFTNNVLVSNGILRATTSASALGAGTSALTLAGGTLQLAHTANLSFNRNTTVTGDSTITADRTASSASSITHTLGTLAIGAQTLTVTRGTNVTTTGVGGIAFTATTLTGAATFAPDTSALLTLASLTSTNTGFAVNGAGNLTISGATNLGTGAVTKSGTGTLAFSGATTYSGGTTINGGLVSFTNASALGTGGITLNGGGLQWSGTNTQDLSGRLTLAGNATFDTGSNNLSFATVLAGPGTLTKAGSGTLTLPTGTTFAGGVTVSAGTLKAPTSALTGSAIGVSGGATLVMRSDVNATSSAPVTASGSASTTATFSFDRSTSGPGVTETFGPLTLGAGMTLALTKTGNVTSGTSTLAFTGNSAFTPGASVTLTVPTGTALTFDSLNANNGNLTWNNATTLTINGTLSNVSQISMNGSSGNGTLVLNGTANTYTGRSNLNGATTVVTKLADLGQPSSLGAPTSASNGTIWISFGTAATLKYIGTADSSTNRTLNLAGNAGIGSILDASGTSTATTGGTVAFTGAVTALSGNHALTLTGTNTGDNLIGGAIPDPSGGVISVIKSGAGNWRLSGNNTYSGGTTINGGTLTVAADSALGNSSGTVTLAGGGLHTTADFTSTRATAVNAGGGAFNVDSNTTVTWNGAVTSAANNGLTKLGGGTLVLGGSNTSFAGGVTLSGGTLSVAANSALGSAIAPVTFNGGTLLATGDFTAQRATTLGAGGGTFNVATNKTLTWNGVITGGAGNNLTKIGGGTLVLGNTAFDAVNGVDPANTYSGLTIVSAGTLTIGSAHALSPYTTLQVAPGAHFNAGSFGQTFSNLTGTGEVNTGTGGATIAPSGVNTFDGTLSGTGGLTMNGTGTLILNAANPNSFGPVTVSQGTLQLGTNGALPTGTPVLLSGSATLDLNNHAATVGKLDGTGGTVALNGANLTINQTDNTAFGGALSGDGGLIKTGSGTLILSGTNDFKGASQVTGGILSINGSAVSASFTVSGGKIGGNGTVGPLTITSGGTLAPGNSPGLLTVVGDLSLSGHTEMELAGLSRGVSYDATDVTGTGAGNIVFGGTLDVILLNGFSPASGNTFDLFNWTGNASGTFANVNLPSLTAGLSWDTTNLYITGELGITGTASAIPEPSTYALLAGFATLGLAVWRRRALARSV